MKKLYYNTFVQLILALYTFSFVACQEFDIDSQPEGSPNIQIDALETYTALATSPSNIVFNISSNTPWNITSDQQWCKPTPSMSASSSLVSEIVITIENNTGKQSRTAKLTITAEGIDEKKVITINQTSKENLVVIPYDELVPTEGADIQFTIASNKPWEIIPSTAFISDIDKKSGTGNENADEETIIIKVPSNGGAKREGTITVKTEFEEYTFTITQNGVVIEMENDPESTTITLEGTGDGTESIIPIRSNKEWKVEVPAEYQSWLKAEAVSETELKVTATTNNLLVNRTGQIIMKTKEVIDGFDGVTFDINQSPAFWFSGSAENREVDEETGYVKMKSVNGNHIVSNYAIQKGTVTFEFEEIHFTAGRIVFNMWPNTGNTNFHFWLRSDEACQITCGGGFAWQQVKPTFTEAEMNAMKTIQFVVEDDPDNAGKLRIRVLIDGKEYANLNNKVNVYETAPDSNPGQIINLQLLVTQEGDYYIIKSITYEPID